MKSKISNLLKTICSEKVSNIDEFNKFKSKINTEINNLFSEFLKLDVSQKREIGPLLNELKTKFNEINKSLSNELNHKNECTDSLNDYSIPVNTDIGNCHPLTNIENKIIKIFSKMGFNLVETQEIEDDWHNFTALNLPLYHPAREMQDTFFIKDFKDKSLRPHTTSCQIRALEEFSLPLKCVTVGRVFRNETISSRSHCYFNQCDGFYVDKNVSIITLIQVFRSLFNELFGANTKIRIRPSYFPFTSPSIEVDVECFLCNSKGCPICKSSGWLEVFGGGVIHENVLKNCNIDSKLYSGIAFGGGIERLSLLIHKIDDIRLFSINNIRFLNQFKFNIL